MLRAKQEDTEAGSNYYGKTQAGFPARIAGVPPAARSVLLPRVFERARKAEWMYGINKRNEV